jgi:NitT/TauT family transport system permease protein
MSEEALSVPAPISPAHGPRVKEKVYLPTDPVTAEEAPQVAPSRQRHGLLERMVRFRESRAAWGDFLLRAGFIALLVALWQAAHYFLVTVPNDLSRGALFPSPLQVAQYIWHGFALDYFTGNYAPPPQMAMPQNYGEALMQADYPRNIGASIWRLLQGYVIATAIGFPLGLLVARSATVDKTLGWLSVAIQSLPSICWIPLALLWFGRVSIVAPILFVTVMGSLFATIVTVADGIRNVPPLMARAGRTLGASGPRLYFAVLLPAALPGIVSGLKVGWSFAWRSLMAAELIVNSGGLGFLLQRDREFGEADGVLATILVIIVIGLLVQEAFFSPLQKRLQQLWGLTGVR